jgi:hypothetical protein
MKIETTESLISPYILKYDNKNQKIDRQICKNLNFLDFFFPDLIQSYLIPIGLDGLSVIASCPHNKYPGHPGPGYPSPGYSSPGYPSPGYLSPGYPSPGNPSPGYPSPGYPSPGYPSPDYPGLHSIINHHLNNSSNDRNKNRNSNLNFPTNPNANPNANPHANPNAKLNPKLRSSYSGHEVCIGYIVPMINNLIKNKSSHKNILNTNIIYVSSIIIVHSHTKGKHVYDLLLALCYQTGIKPFLAVEKCIGEV